MRLGDFITLEICKFLKTRVIIFSNTPFGRDSKTNVGNFFARCKLKKNYVVNASHIGRLSSEIIIVVYWLSYKAELNSYPLLRQTHVVMFLCPKHLGMYMKKAYETVQRMPFF